MRSIKVKYVETHIRCYILLTLEDGETVGLAEGDIVGPGVGLSDGEFVGLDVMGALLGDLVGLGDGWEVGVGVGLEVKLRQ